MRAFDLLALSDRNLVPEKCKIHLATVPPSGENPLELFRAGQFEEWQRTQTKKNFPRDIVVALIDLPESHRWLFGGAYTVKGCAPANHRGKDVVRYDLRELASCRELKGRLVVAFRRPGRQSYLNAESWTNDLRVAEVLAEPLSFDEFPGFKAVDISKTELDAIVGHRVASWRSALSSVGGVYLITDTADGQLYVGSAAGKDGFWGRWSQYSATGHGGNRELKSLVRERGAGKLRFSILEIADLTMKPSDLRDRESHWKRVLLTRDHGLNRN
jgi:hypothetical protein